MSKSVIPGKSRAPSAPSYDVKARFNGTIRIRAHRTAGGAWMKDVAIIPSTRYNPCAKHC